MKIEDRNVFDVLLERGLIAQSTNMDKVKDLLGKEKVTFYIGFDGTADSLHIGHFLPIKVMMHMQQAGHKPIALLGTGTTIIGDPSGRSEERQMLSEETIDHNADLFYKQISKYVDFSDDKALVRRNGDWLKDINYMDFLRDYGTHFSINRMLAMDSVKTRLEKGLTFFEFNYMLLQSYDFLHLFREDNCVLQIGGDDQWSNIIGGVDLIRRVEAKESYGLTNQLLVKSDGTKMGKTAGGAVWIDPEKLSPYEFYQYFRNSDDADMTTLLKFLTFLPIEEINELDKLEGSDINKAKEILAFEITKIIHGEDEAKKAEDAAKSIFLAGDTNVDMPTTVLKKEDFKNDEIGLLNLIVKTELAGSNSDARRLITQGGITIDDNQITDPGTQINISDIAKDGLIIKRGKKVFHKVLLSSIT